MLLNIKRLQKSKKEMENMMTKTTHKQVVIVEPGKPARAETIELPKLNAEEKQRELEQLAVPSELAALHAVVGGSIELVKPDTLRKNSTDVCPLPNKYDIICNGNGHYRELPCNRWGLVGTFLIQRSHPSGSWQSLTDKEAQEVVQAINENES